ncbi:MAG: glycosyltransferase family 2 protein [Pyrinomonadaceae bacterium]
MPEINFQNIFTIFAWSISILWLIAFIWTIYCLQKQKTLEIKTAKDQANQTFVSILVPARNEAHRVLKKSISSMLVQTYKNYELIVLNDRSTDNTREILEDLKIQNERLKIIEGKEPDKTWLGKPHALEQAFKNSKGEWILTADADIIFAPETLQIVVKYAEENNFDAVTLIPKQVFGSFWEKLFMPVFGWFCLLAMPLHRVNASDRKESMGVGNFFMFRREVLEKIGGFKCVRAEVAEDLKLAEILKNKKFKLRIDYAEFIETRMYSGFREIWEGFTKNLFSGMKFSIAKTIFGSLSILIFGVLPIFFAGIFLLFANFSLFLPLFTAYVFQILIFIFINLKWRGNMFYALFTPIGLTLFLAILANSTVKVLSGKGVTWKGRPIYEKGGVPPPVN